RMSNLPSPLRGRGAGDEADYRPCPSHLAVQKSSFRCHGLPRSANRPSGQHLGPRLCRRCFEDARGCVDTTDFRLGLSQRDQQSQAPNPQTIIVALRPPCADGSHDLRYRNLLSPLAPLAPRTEVLSAARYTSRICLSPENRTRREQATNPKYYLHATAR